MPISERPADARQNVLALIAEALSSRGELYGPGGAAAVAETILGEYERDRGGLCETCQLSPRELCRACGAGTGGP